VMSLGKAVTSPRFSYTVKLNKDNFYSWKSAILDG